MAKNDEKRKKLLAARASKRQAVLANAPGAPKAVEAVRLNPAYGYALGDDGETLVPNEEEAAVLTRMRALADKNLHTREIASKLSDEGLTCRGTAWDSKLVTRVLRRKVTKSPGLRPQQGVR